MTERTTSPDRIYRHVVNQVVGLVGRPVTTFDTDEALKAMALLFGLFFLAAPTVLLTVGTEPILLVAVIVAVSGTVYASYLLYTGCVFEGVVAAFVFFAPFNLRLPLFPAPERAHGYVLLFDLAMVPLLALLLYWQRDDGFDLFEPRLTKLVAGSVFLLVAWTWLTVPFGAGPSQIAMVAWALEQTRYGLVFLTALLAVRYVGLESTVLLTVGSVAAQAVFSIVQIVNGESPDRLYFLGSQIGGRISTVDVFGLALESGLYAGGFVGSSRDLGVLVLLTAPAAVYFASMERRSTVPYLLFLALGAVQLAFTYSVSMFGSFLVLSTLLVLVVVLWVRSVYPTSTSRRAAGSVLVMPFVLGAIYVTPVLALATGLVNTLASLVPKPGGGNNDVEPSTTESPPSDGTTSTPVGTDTPTPTDTPATNGTSTPVDQGPVTRELKDSERVVVDFADTLPLVSTDTLPYRITQYDAAVRMAQDFPLFGVGGYNFILLSKEYDGFRQLDAVHNTFIAYLAGSGLPGLAFYLVSVLLVLGSVIHKFVTDSTNATPALFLGAGMVALHAASFWTLLYTTPGPYVVFWLIAGLVVGSE